MSGAPSVFLRHYRIRIDGKLVNSTPTWGAAEDTTYWPGEDVPFRLRIAIDNVAGTGAASSNTWQHRVNSGTWTTTTTTTSPVKYADIGVSATLGAATAITTAALRLTVPGSGTAVTGSY